MTCNDVEAALVWNQAKDPNDTDDYAVDFEKALTNWWEAGRSYLAAARVRVAGQSGLELECSIAGQAGIRPPRITNTIGASVVDGSVTWIVRALSTASLITTISGVPAWTADTGITLTNPSVSGQKAITDIASGTDGQDYTVLVTATLASGKTKTAVCVLRVRRAVRVCEA